MASEELDHDPRWRPFTSGELLHVCADTRLHFEQLTAPTPQHPLTLADLGPSASDSQR